MTQTNIKNLPDGEYFTENGYSDSKPWMVVGRTAKTVTLVRVEVKPDPDFKPEFHPGGFSAHCSNQQDQTWLFAGVGAAKKTVRHTAKKNQQTWHEGAAVYFHDYNF